MEERLDLRKIMDSKVHWSDPELHNPCTRFFVEYCCDAFNPNDGFTGVGDTYAHFHSWVNEQAHPYNIPPELTLQMWQMRGVKQRCPGCGSGRFGWDTICEKCKGKISRGELKIPAVFLYPPYMA